MKTNEYAGSACREQYQKEFSRRAEEMLEEVIRRSGIDIARNRRMAKKYRRIQKRIQKETERTHASDLAEKLSPRYVQYLKNKGEKLLEDCASQVQPLLMLLDDNMTYALVRETLPEFHLDESFDIDSFSRSREIFGMYMQDSPESSTVGVLSGTFRGHPFLVEKKKHICFEEEEFSEDQTVSWHTEQEKLRWRGRTVEGVRLKKHLLWGGINLLQDEMGPQVDTLTLHASLKKQVPAYRTSTRLFFGCDAAPELSFLHVPQAIRDEHYQTPSSDGVGKQPEELFPALFSTDFCSDAAQFASLMDEKARANMVELICCGSPYGDDFYFEKQKNVTVIESIHGQDWDLTTAPETYASYDLEEIREKFLKRNAGFFAQFYDAFAPIFCIPQYCLLQEKKTAEADPAAVFPLQSAEILANSFPPSALGHAKTDSELILKSEFLKSEGEVYHFAVTAASYRRFMKKEAVQVRGENDIAYPILVPYPEYYPLEKVTEMEVRRLHMTDEAFRRSRYHADPRPHVFVHDWYAVAGETLSQKAAAFHGASENEAIMKDRK